MPQQISAAFKCLIVEDDACMAQTIAAAVELEGGEPTICCSIASATNALQTDWQVVILDNYLPDGKGDAFFAYLRSLNFFVPCIMLTGIPELPVAVELTRDGLFEYLTKPFDVEVLRKCLHSAVQNLQISNISLNAFGVVDLSPAMKSIRGKIFQATANPTTTVLLTGETGVGKDVIARLIHQLTFQKRETLPTFLSLNCSTLPSEIFEAELFGVQKGAFTGAHQSRMGLGEAAEGGTLFLDEIGEVPLLLQAKLLQFLENREFRRVGSTQTQLFKGRIIAATNRDLVVEVREKRFREDLLYRLNVLNIAIPPLRKRREDIPSLCDKILTTLCSKSNRKKPQIKRRDLVKLCNFNFPGNVRELRNILERSLIQTSSKSSWLDLDINSFSLPPERPSNSGRDLPPLEAQEYKTIDEALQIESWSIRGAARLLKITPQSLLRRLKKWPELHKKKSGTNSID